MNYCANCTSYDYCSARKMCMDPPFGYCTRYQPKSWCEVKMDEFISNKKCSECLRAQNITGLRNDCSDCRAKMEEVTEDV